MLCKSYEFVVNRKFLVFLYCISWYFYSIAYLGLSSFLRCHLKNFGSSCCSKSTDWGVGWIVLEVLRVCCLIVGSVDAHIDDVGLWSVDVDVVLVDSMSVVERVLVHWAGHVLGLEDECVDVESIGTLVDILAVVRRRLD